MKNKDFLKIVKKCDVVIADIKSVGSLRVSKLELIKKIGSDNIANEDFYYSKENNILMML